MGCGDVRLLRTIGGVDFTRQERATLNKLTMPSWRLHGQSQDPAKSATNKAKHGIDFDEAQVLWKDARMLEAPAKTDDEPRVLVIGKIGDNHWAAVCAHRGDTVRIISVRRARKQEIDHYESQ